jgi:hypothetical protein
VIKKKKRKKERKKEKKKTLPDMNFPNPQSP